MGVYLDSHWQARTVLRPVRNEQFECDTLGSRIGNWGLHRVVLHCGAVLSIAMYAGRGDQSACIPRCIVGGHRSGSVGLLGMTEGRVVGSASRGLLVLDMVIRHGNRRFHMTNYSICSSLFGFSSMIVDGRVQCPGFVGG